jgi:hypothetical protein
MFYCDDSHVPSGGLSAEIGPDLFRVFYGALFPLDFRSSVSYVPDVAFRSALFVVSTRGSARQSSDVARQSPGTISTYHVASCRLISAKTWG